MAVEAVEEAVEGRSPDCHPPHDHLHRYQRIAALVQASHPRLHPPSSPHLLLGRWQRTLVEAAEWGS